MSHIVSLKYFSLPSYALILILMCLFTLLPPLYVYNNASYHGYIINNVYSDQQQQNATHNYGIHIISYGDSKWKKAKQRIFEEASNTNWFDTIEVYGPHNLTSDFKQEFGDIINLRIGGGYWLW
eukprot:UN13747